LSPVSVKPVERARFRQSFQCFFSELRPAREILDGLERFFCSACLDASAFFNTQAFHVA
jgi:hypothetical protein